jgi:hypothetical protein
VILHGALSIYLTVYLTDESLLSFIIGISPLINDIAVYYVNRYVNEQLYLHHKLLGGPRADVTVMTAWVLGCSAPVLACSAPVLRTVPVLRTAPVLRK